MGWAEEVVVDSVGAEGAGVVNMICRTRLREGRRRGEEGPEVARGGSRPLFSLSLSFLWVARSVQRLSAVEAKTTAPWLRRCQDEPK